MKAKIDNRFHQLEVAMRQAQSDIKKLAEATGLNKQAIIKLENESEQRFDKLEEWSKGADDMLTELNHALPDPEYDAKCEAVADVEASLDKHRERLGLNKPKVGDVYVVVDSRPDTNDVKVGCKHIVRAMNNDGDFIFNSSYIAHQTKDGKLEIYGLGVVLEKLDEPKKQLGQSVFDGLDEKWQFAAVDADGKAHRCNLHVKPHHERGEFWRGCTFPPLEFELIGEGYDATNWQNSLIERDDIAKELLEVDLSSELKGSDLCRYLKSKKHWVLAVVSDKNDATAEFHQRAVIVTDITSDGSFKCGDTAWRYAVPIDHRGEPLTASEVGL